LWVVANIITRSSCCFQKCSQNLGCKVCIRFCPRCGLLFNCLQPASGADDVNGESKPPVAAIHDEVDGLALCEWRSEGYDCTRCSHATFKVLL
jgi:hypothetical protein